jgi:GNAT superfamily N-acetyltransferase
VSAGIEIEPVSDAAWPVNYIRRHWGVAGVVSRGKLRTGGELTALRASVDGDIAGVVSWQIEAGSAEIVTLDSDKPGHRVGTKLLEAAVGELRAAHVRRVWLITTNDNTDALRFYQRRGWRLVALYPNAVAESRKLKPSIPETGAHGIPIRDEIELEYPL